ncbi:hypothetical protein [Paraburkholderia caballeronis]|uniref:hypothetical protein n=1 Tax=Paraburkholderia caballeronis TaxID=416943 RepID=UPI00143079A7|nr:hypothetical protein [Paraburkholderia caballeronis]
MADHADAAVQSCETGFAINDLAASTRSALLSRRAAVRPRRHVFHPGSDAMPGRERAPVHGPARAVVAVVNLPWIESAPACTDATASSPIAVQRDVQEGHGDLRGRVRARR